MKERLQDESAAEAGAAGRAKHMHAQQQQQQQQQQFGVYVRFGEQRFNLLSPPRRGRKILNEEYHLQQQQKKGSVQQHQE